MGSHRSETAKVKGFIGRSTPPVSHIAYVVMCILPQHRKTEDVCIKVELSRENFIKCTKGSIFLVRSTVITYIWLTREHNKIHSICIQNYIGAVTYANDFVS
jgi:hypothetical protein